VTSRGATPVGVWWRDGKKLLRAALFLAVSREAAFTQEAGSESGPSGLTESWAARPRLADSGISPFAVLTTEGWGNVSGGVKTGGWWNSLLRFGVELDTAQLGWWEGGTFLAQVDWVENIQRNGSFSDYTGGFNPVSGIMAGDQLRVFNLYYRQSWREGAVVLKAGQIAVDDDFMRSEYAGLFLNSAFGAMPSQVGTPLATSAGNPTAFPIYSVAAPGVFLAVRPADPFTTQVGLYCGRTGFDVPSNHGFDWVHERPAELGLFWENRHALKIAGRAGRVGLGLSYHTGTVDDFTTRTPEKVAATTQTAPNYYLNRDHRGPAGRGQLLATAFTSPEGAGDNQDFHMAVLERCWTSAPTK
jgi:porin